jgi:serine/threonine protein kinase
MPTRWDEETDPGSSSEHRLEESELVLARYRLESPIGRGGFGDVWAATDVRTGRKVTVRVPNPGNDMARALFARETRALSRLDHHGIISLLDAEDGFVVTEMLSGRTLRHLIDATPPEEREDLLWIVRDVANAMAYSHSRGVIHRDLKPDNVFIQEHDGRKQAKVLDFAISKLDDDSDEERGTVVGTPLYMSPEAVRGDDVGTATDVYSLGVLLFELLTGRRPFDASTVEDLMRQKLDNAPVEIPKTVSKPHAILLNRMLSGDPRLRPAMAEVAHQLDDAKERKAIAVAHRFRRADRSSPGIPLAVGSGAVFMAVANAIGGGLSGGEGFVLGTGIGLGLVLIALVIEVARAP